MELLEPFLLSIWLFLCYGLVTISLLMKNLMIYRLKIICWKLLILFGTFYYPFLSILDNKKVPCFL